MKMLAILVVLLMIPVSAYAQNGDGSTYRCQNSELVHIGDSAFMVKLKCGKPLHKEVINTGYGKGGQIVSEWYYLIRNGWYGVLTIRAGKLVKIDTIRR